MTDVLNISSKTKIEHSTLYNLIGQQVGVYATDNTSINMQSLSTGIYLLNVQFENGQAETVERSRPSLGNLKTFKNNLHH